jgi:glycerophosphoryl diester phosphodiesterase
MKVIAHRGLYDGGFENSLSSISLSVQKGIEYIEIDVRKTADGELILFHDPYYDRLTNFKGMVSDSLAPAKLGIKLNNGEDIAVLQDVIDIVKHKAILIIEIKSEDAFPDVYNLVSSSMSPGEFIIVSFYHKKISDLKKLYPSLKTGIILEAVLADFDDYLNGINADFVIFSIDTYNAEQIQVISSQRRDLIFYGVNEPKDVALAMEAGAYGIITNFPEKARKILQM